MDIRSINYDGAMNLCAAIVERAAKDYLKARKGLYLEHPRNEERIERFIWIRDDILRFFRSRWFESICSLDPQWLVQKLDEEYEKWVADPNHKLD